MIICDAVWRDPGTGKFFLLGTFSTIGSATFPSRHPQLVVYSVLTDGRGKTQLQLCFVSADEEHILAEAEAEVNFSDPRANLEMALQFSNIEFPAPGEYRLKMNCGNELLMERRLLLVQLQTQTGDSNE